MIRLIADAAVLVAAAVAVGWPVKATAAAAMQPILFACSHQGWRPQILSCGG